MKFRWKMIFSFLLLSSVFYVLFISQVRAALVKSLLGCGFLLVVLMLKKIKTAYQAALILTVLTVIALSFVKLDDPRFRLAEQRLMALNQFSKVWDARSQGQGDSILHVLREAPLGAGLSRVGAASEPFKDLIQADTKFGPLWSFADNLYKALLTEIGIPGLLLYMSFLTLICFLALQGILSNKSAVEVLFFQAAAMGAVLGAISGHLGSEGFLYQPESTIVWIFLGSLVKLSQTKGLTLLRDQINR